MLVSGHEMLTMLVAEMRKDYAPRVMKWADAIEAALATVPPSGWQPISSAPKIGPHIDLWAKAWIPAFDRFEFRRFADCWWYPGDSMTNSNPHWMGLDKEWFATHWMLPASPGQEPG